MIHCRENTARIEKARHGKLSAWERLGMFIHLLYCKACRLFKKQSAFIDGRARKHAEHTLTEEEKNKMKDWIVGPGNGGQ